jgi:hypothetical protein
MGGTAESDQIKVIELVAFDAIKKIKLTSGNFAW